MSRRWKTHIAVLADASILPGDARTFCGRVVPIHNVHETGEPFGRETCRKCRAQFTPGLIVRKERSR